MPPITPEIQKVQGLHISQSRYIRFAPEESRAGVPRSRHYQQNATVSADSIVDCGDLGQPLQALSIAIRVEETFPSQLFVALGSCLLDASAMPFQALAFVQSPFEICDGSGCCGRSCQLNAGRACGTHGMLMTYRQPLAVVVPLISWGSSPPWLPWAVRNGFRWARASTRRQVLDEPGAALRSSVRRDCRESCIVWRSMLGCS